LKNPVLITDFLKLGDSFTSQNLVIRLGQEIITMIESIFNLETALVSCLAMIKHVVQACDRVQLVTLKGQRPFN
jgi:hypothetical protein